MAECPFCKDIAAAVHLLGAEKTCFHCGKLIVRPEPVARTQSRPGPVMRSQPAPLMPPAKDKSSPRMPIPKAEAVAPQAFTATASEEGGWKMPPALAAAFLCGSLALCLNSVPALSLLTKPLALPGAALGILFGLVPAFGKKTRFWLAAAVTLLSLYILLFVGRWSSPAPPRPAPLLAVALDLNDPRRVPLQEDEWADAATYAVSLHDVRVTVASVLPEAGDRLEIRLKMTLDGIAFKHYLYEPWSNSAGGPSKHPPTLTDDQDISYPQKNTTSPEGAYIVPGRTIGDDLIFQVPAANLRTLKYLRLKLPGGAGARGRVSLSNSSYHDRRGLTDEGHFPRKPTACLYSGGVAGGDCDHRVARWPPGARGAKSSRGIGTD